MPARVLRFGVFEFDAQSRELRRHGLKVRLPDQAFQILRLLLARPGEVVTREELRQQLWTSDTFVDFDDGLNSAIRKLREALGDSAENPRFVETVPRCGYRFIGSVAPAVADHIAETQTDVTAPARPRALEARATQQYVSGFGIALIYDALGENEPALAAFGRAYQDRAVEFSLMREYPPFKTIASDSRYQARMREIGLPR